MEYIVEKTQKVKKVGVDVFQFYISCIWDEYWGDADSYGVYEFQTVL